MHIKKFNTLLTSSVDQDQRADDKCCKYWEEGLDCLVCGVLLCFCHFPVWCPGSGVVIDCIDFLSLPPFLQCSVKAVFLRHLTHNISNRPTQVLLSGTLFQEILVFFFMFSSLVPCFNGIVPYYLETMGHLSSLIKLGLT